MCTNDTNDIILIQTLLVKIPKTMRVTIFQNKLCLYSSISLINVANVRFSHKASTTHQSL